MKQALVIGFILLLILFTSIYCIPGFVRAIFEAFGPEACSMQELVDELRKHEVKAKVIMVEGNESLMIRYPNSKGDRYVFIPRFYGDCWGCHYLWRPPLLPKPKRVYAYLGACRFPKDARRVVIRILHFLEISQTTGATSLIEQMETHGYIVESVFPIG